MHYFDLSTPSFPYYVEANQDVFFKGERHIDRKNFEFFDFIFVTKGALFLTEENQSYTVSANQGLILAPLLHHFSHLPVSEETHFYWIHFQTTGTWSIHQQPNRTLQNQLIIPNFFELPHPEMLLQLFERLCSLSPIITDNQIIEREIILLQLLKILVTNVSEDSSSRISDIAHDAAALINSKFASSISVQSIANELNFHPTYISRCMKKIYGISTKQYIQELRMNHAQSLLKSSNHSIEAVSLMSGFSSLSFFSKSFTKHMGLSPKEFRNHYRF